MSPSSDPSTPPLPPASPRVTPPPATVSQFAAFVVEPLEAPIGLLSAFDALLKKPGQVVYEISRGRAGAMATSLFTLLVLSFAVFGFLLGIFIGGVQLWAAPVKVVAGALLSGLICLPSLYIFSCLGGADVRARSIAGVLLVSLSLTGLLLLAFSPVVWLFSQASESVVFFGALALAFWLIALLFGLRLLHVAAAHFGLKSSVYLVLWTLIFIAVTLQMTASLRPIIDTAPTFLPTRKKFFLQHWVDCMTGRSPS